MIDGEITVWDSLAIVEYIAEIHVQVWPSDKTARAWARSAAAEMHSGFATLRQLCTMNCSARTELNEITPELKLSAISQKWVNRMLKHPAMMEWAESALKEPKIAH
nr:hypothetical protein [Xenorhabdus sp. TS4]